MAGAWGCKNGILNKYLHNFEFKLKKGLNIRGCDQDFLIQIYYENISNIQLYIPEKINKNQFYEKNIKYISGKGRHIGSYNYFCPKTRSLLMEDNKQLTVKRYYSFGKNNESFRNAFRTITLIPADGGPGNQIIGIKECLILAILLNRICIIPPIREHYLKSNTTFYNFGDIFNLNLPNTLIDDSKSSILNHINNNKIYSIHSKYFNKMLRHERLIDYKDKREILLRIRKIKNNDSINELKAIDDNLIIIKYLFNNVNINECGINGCFKCDFNSNFKNIYSEICSKWDFSDNIKSLGQKYIKSTFKNLDYIAIHIRMPDIISKTIDKYTNNVYTNQKIVDIISNVKTENNKPIFVCSNNISYLKKIGVSANFINISHKYISFIEQYICCMSDKFYYLNLQKRQFGDKHNRSTWESFVIDYRMFLNKSKNNYNLKKVQKSCLAMRLNFKKKFKKKYNTTII